VAKIATLTEDALLLTHYNKGLFGSAILISAISIIAFLKSVFLKSLLFKIAQAFGETY
jgi:hypothetical protein